MLRNNTRFLIELLPYQRKMRWQIIEPTTKEMLAHAHSWDHADSAEYRSAKASNELLITATLSVKRTALGVWRRSELGLK